MGYALATEQGGFYFETCCTCGVAFAMPQDFKATRYKDHLLFYCPNGHAQHYTAKTNEEKLREQLTAQEQLTATERNRREWAETEKKATERRLSATRGKVTLLKRRMGRGQCPCCKQKFADLCDHMTQQHPGYGEAE